MAQLPGGTFLIQQIGDQVVLYNRWTEQEIVKYDSHDGDATAKAQKSIYDSGLLDPEDKCFAHFWCGYFYAHATTGGI